MILRSNLREVGLRYGGAMFEGIYVGAFDGEVLAGVVAHYWNDNIVLAAGEHVEPLVAHAVAASGRRVRGLLGTHAEVTEASRVLLSRARAGAPRHAGREILFALDLSHLVVPDALATLTARTPDDAELPMLLEWRMAYAAETMGTADTPKARQQQEDSLRAFHANFDDVLLLAEGRPVAYSGFNAIVMADSSSRPAVVQVGGVWTPPALRRRGYARCAVAASLLRMRDRGATKAILFTAEDNVPAQRSYVALGFRVTGDYAVAVYD